jgi:hypothetical protein
MPLPAIAAVAALAAAAHLARKRGSRSVVPQGYTASPEPFWSESISGTVERMFSREELEEELGLFHVTTARSKVLAQRLKSRAQLRAQVGDEGRSYGLGGGEDHADRISVSVTRSGADKIYRALRTAILASQGRLPESQAALEVMGWTGFPRSVIPPSGPIDEHIAAEIRYLMSLLGGQDYDPFDEDGNLVYSDREISRMARDGHTFQDLAKSMPSSGDPKSVLKLINRMEISIHDIARLDDWSGCLPVAILLEDAASMARMNADEVAILRLAAKNGARAVAVPSECELRFRPEDLVVLEEVEPRI